MRERETRKLQIERSYVVKGVTGEVYSHHPAPHTNNNLVRVSREGVLCSRCGAESAV